MKLTMAYERFGIHWRPQPPASAQPDAALERQGGPSVNSAMSAGKPGSTPNRRAIGTRPGAEALERRVASLGAHDGNA